MDRNRAVYAVHVMAMAVFLMLTAIATVPAWYWLFVQQAPLQNIKVDVIDEITWPGGFFRIKVSADVVGDCPYVVVYEIRDARGDVFSVTTDKLAINAISSIELPKDIASGNAEYVQTIYFNCNPIKSHIVKMPTVKLYVVS